MLCLPKKISQNFLQALKAGKLNPEDLSKMSSTDRRAFISEYVGDGASEAVNVMFEKRLLMKNQNNAMISWVKDVAGLRPQVKRDLISKIEKLDKVLTPEEEVKFLGDLVSDKLGTRTSFEDAKVISELSKNLTEAKKLPMGDINYGIAEVKLNNYINELRLKNDVVSIGDRLIEAKTNLPGAVGRSFKDLADVTKGMKASLDNSAIFRQGWKTMFTNPQIWGTNALKSFKDLGNSFSGKGVIDGIKAEIYSRANARNGYYKAMKLDVGNLEEAFPTTLPEKIPLLGKLYKASEAAYTGFLYRTRADIADKLIKIAEDQGIDMTQKLQSESIGRLVNSLTGRGNLGPLEKVAGELNTVLFSPKMLKSQIDILTTPLGFDVAGNQVSKFARKEAQKNILKVASGMATILLTAEALRPGSVEWDARSSDFGKIRIGDTRFDMSGGLGSVMVLATRMARSSIKSSTTGKVTELNAKNKDGSAKFGSQTKTDVFWNFIENKYSPIASAINQIANQETFEGKKPTVKSIANDIFTPLIVDNLYSSSKEAKAANLLLIGLAETFGISTNTYSNK